MQKAFIDAFVNSFICCIKIMARMAANEAAAIALNVKRANSIAKGLESIFCLLSVFMVKFYMGCESHTYEKIQFQMQL